MYNLVNYLCDYVMPYRTLTTFPELIWHLFLGFMAMALVLYILDLTFYTIRLITKGI